MVCVVFQHEQRSREVAPLNNQGGITMKVRDLMTSDVQYCGPDSNLAAAAKMMWDSDCGALPVLSREGRVIGVLTDRDICMAAATKNRPPSELTAWETISGKAYTCQPSDDIHTALALMQRERVRRLPVVDDDGVLQGIIAMNDCVLKAEPTTGKKAPDLSYEDVVLTLKGISAHRVLAAA
jgi:CBS-domain-containing membrane protein